MSWLITPRYVGAAVSDADAQAYLRAVETADGQALEPAVARAVNDFVIGCKADGIWSAIKASCILAGARTLNGALVPLVGTAPTNNNFVSGDYDRKTGLVGNGSTKYLNSNRNNNADPQNSNHNAAYQTTTTNTGGIFGATLTDASGAGGNYLDSAGNSRNRSETQVLTNVSATAGLVGHSRALSSSYTIRTAGQNITANQASNGLLNASVLVYRRQITASPAYSTARLAFYSIGESLNLALLDARVTTLINAFAAAIP
jgi:hypothetical protein